MQGNEFSSDKPTGKALPIETQSAAAELINGK
jgi:hypothetical protein